MKTIRLILPYLAIHTQIIKALVLGILLSVAWKYLPILLRQADKEVAVLDTGIWQLLLFALIVFMATLTLCILLFKWLLRIAGFPIMDTLVLQFKNLQLWQQFVFYWASFALLLLGASFSLIAIF